jgi:hypothetical protein
MRSQSPCSSTTAAASASKPRISVRRACFVHYGAAFKNGGRPPPPKGQSSGPSLTGTSVQTPAGPGPDRASPTYRIVGGVAGLPQPRRRGRGGSGGRGRRHCGGGAGSDEGGGPPSLLAAVAWWCGVAGCVGLCVGITRVPLVCCVGFELVKQSINQSINQSARRVIAQANTATRTPAIGRGGGWRGLACSHATSFATTHQHWCCFDYPKFLLASQRAPLKNARAHVLTVETGWLRKFPRGPFNGPPLNVHKQRGGAARRRLLLVASIPFVGNTLLVGQIRTSIDRAGWCFEAVNRSTPHQSRVTHGHEHQISAIVKNTANEPAPRPPRPCC